MNTFAEIQAMLPMMIAIIITCLVAFLIYQHVTKAKRSQEFNEMADPLREKLSALIVMAGDPNAYPTWVEAAELQPLLAQCDFFLKRKLKKAFVDYSDSLLFTCSFTSSSCYEVLDEAKLQQSLATLLDCLQSK